MNTTHTPWPWAADQNGLIHAGKNRLHIAQAATTGMGHAADANARLIAAAPELLEALRGMLAVWPYMECNETRSARAAIAKATGKAA